MEIKTGYKVADCSGNVLMLPVYEQEDLFKTYTGLDEKCPWLKNNEALEGFSLKKGDLLPVYGDKSAKLRVVLLAGAGKREEAQVEDIRILAAKTVKKCKKLGLGAILFPAEALTDITGGLFRLVQETVYAALIALYDFTEFKTRK